MIKTNKSKIRILSMLLLAALILTAMPAAALAESFSAAVKSKSMKVYADENGRKYLGSLPKKTIVTVLDHEDGIAKIRYNGKIGYAKVSSLRSVESFAEEAKTTRSTRVYQKPNTFSASVKISKGTKVYVLAVSGGIAMVEKNGKVGYMNEDHLRYISYTAPAVNPDSSASSDVADKETQEAAKDAIEKLPEDVVEKIPDSVIDELEKGEATTKDLEDLKAALEKEYEKQKAEEEKKEESKKEEPKKETIEETFNSGKYSNEQLCYLFATKVMGYNDAAAAGLLANIKAESGFRTNANGDSGRSYGICQWFSSRKTRLLNWCEDNGKDPASLIGQLYFLKYELETYYPAVHKYMKNVENSAQGAFDAAYYFCYHFEAPANKASKSTSRGNSAMNTFYPKYAA